MGLKRVRDEAKQAAADPTVDKMEEDDEVRAAGATPV